MIAVYFYDGQQGVYTTRIFNIYFLTHDCLNLNDML
jgi:hypothetical protein